jgi:hypothetical protein
VRILTSLLRLPGFDEDCSRLIGGRPLLLRLPWKAVKPSGIAQTEGAYSKRGCDPPFLRAMCGVDIEDKKETCSSATSATACCRSFRCDRPVFPLARTEMGPNPVNASSSPDATSLVCPRREAAPLSSTLAAAAEEAAHEEPFVRSARGCRFW